MSSLIILRIIYTATSTISTTSTFETSVLRHCIGRKISEWLQKLLILSYFSLVYASVLMQVRWLLFLLQPHPFLSLSMFLHCIIFFFFLLEPAGEFGRFKSRKLSLVFLKVAFSSPKVRDFCDRKCRIDKEAFPERYRFSSFDFHWTEYKQLKNTRTTFFKKKTVIRWQTGVSLLSSSIPIRSRIFQLFFFSTARIIWQML